jgi:hypothetical protein
MFAFLKAQKVGALAFDSANRPHSHSETGCVPAPVANDSETNRNPRSAAPAHTRTRTHIHAHESARPLSASGDVCCAVGVDGSIFAALMFEVRDSSSAALHMTVS